MVMEKKIEKIKKFRLFLLSQVEALTAGQLNSIPSGYNNNIIWNIGHLISAQQTMCYIRAGLPVTIDDKYFNSYLSGTKPGAFVDDKEISIIKELLLSTIDRLQTDYDKKLFINYTPSAGILKVYGFEVNNIDEALEYLLYHEGFHGGYITALKRLV